MSVLAALLGRGDESFAGELRDLIDNWRDQPATALEELVDAMETEVEVLVEEVNAR